MNGTEHFEEGAQGFMEKLSDEIYERYQAESEGQKTPFFTEQTERKSLESAIGFACYRRTMNFSREAHLQRIYRTLHSEEYIVYREGDADLYADVSERRYEVGREEDLSWFWEPLSGVNRSPESVLEEKQLNTIFDKEHQELKKKGKDGPLYYKAILFYLKGYHHGLSKRDEMTALSRFLGENRKRTREIKCRARKFLFEAMSQTYDLHKHRRNIRKRQMLAKRLTKKISEKKLAEIYRKQEPKPEVRTLRHSIKDYSPAEIAELTEKHRRFNHQLDGSDIVGGNASHPESPSGPKKTRTDPGKVLQIERLLEPSQQKQHERQMDEAA
jgi:hypothetical protein